MQNLDDRVRAVANSIATGDVMTYGEIGQITGLHPRQVGRIVARVADDIPWWRVVRVDGTPASCHEGRALALLEQEEIPLAGGRVDWRTLRGEHCAAAAGRSWAHRQERADEIPRY